MWTKEKHEAAKMAAHGQYPSNGTVYEDRDYCEGDNRCEKAKY